MARDLGLPVVRRPTLLLVVLVWTHGLLQAGAYDGVWPTRVALAAVTALILLPLSGSWERSGRQLGAVLLVAATAPTVLMAGRYARPLPSNQGRVPVFAVLTLSLLLFRGLHLLVLACFVVLTGSFLLGGAVAGADVGRIVVGHIPYQAGCFLVALVANGAMRLTGVRAVRAAREACLERTRRLVRTVEQHERERLLDEVAEAAVSPALRREARGSWRPRGGGPDGRTVVPGACGRPRHHPVLGCRRTLRARRAVASPGGRRARPAGVSSATALPCARPLAGSALYL